MTQHALPKQPAMWYSYLICGRLLHGATLLFVLESYLYWLPLERAIRAENNLLIAIWTGYFLFSFVHIFLVSADAWSRFQNYKRAKDQLYEYGFKERIINQYIGSKCQRIAVETAAKELGYEEQTRAHFKKKGYKWYHYIPDFMIQDPWFPFKKYFWRRTFLEKHYEPKFNYQELSTQMEVR